MKWYPIVQALLSVSIMAIQALALRLQRRQRLRDLAHYEAMVKANDEMTESLTSLREYNDRIWRELQEFREYRGF